MSPWPQPSYRLLWLGDGGLDEDKIYVGVAELGPDPLAALRALRVQYVVLKRYNVADPVVAPLADALARGARRVATVSPYRDDVAADTAAAAPFLHNADRPSTRGWPGPANRGHLPARMTSTPASVAAASTPTLSLVVPVFNEAQRLEATLPRFVAWLSDAPFSSELVVVDDGSVDGTAALAAQLLAAGVGRVLREPHRGKGGAVRAGMLAAQGRYRVFMDVDLATPLEFVTPCLSRLQNGVDVVIGSRRVAAAEIEQHQAPLREFLGLGLLPVVVYSQRRPSLGLHLWLQGVLR